MHGDQILATLTFTGEPPPLLQYLERSKDCRLAHALDEVSWAAAIESTPECRRYLDQVGRLSPDHKLRLLRGGLAYRCLYGFDPSRLAPHLGELLPLVAAELCVQGDGEDGPPEGSWTSDNAFYIPAGPRAPRIDVEAIRYGSWAPEEPFVSPRLPGGQVVDFESPMTRANEPRSGILNGPFHPYSPDEQRRIVDRLDGSMQLIACVTPVAAELINRFTRTIRVRLRKTGDYGSEQVPVETGTIRLSNLHTPSLDEVLIAESLIHESIHNFLSTYEYLIMPLSPEYEFDSQARPISPWSDNPIPHASFTHAICVYYGMWSFVRACEEAGIRPSASRLSQRRLKSASGFLQGPRISAYIETIGETHPQIAAMFDKMQQHVLREESDRFRLRRQSVRDLYLQKTS